MANKTVTVGPGKNYAGLQAAITGEVAENSNLITMGGILNVVLYAFNDTTGATVTGLTTDNTHYVNIYVDPTARHAGVWNGSAYNLSVAGNCLTIQQPYTRVDGIQVGVGTSGDYGSSYNGIQLLSGANNCVISGSLIANKASQSFHIANTGIYGDSNAGANVVVNNVMYDFYTSVGGGYTGTGINWHYGSGGCYFYNNTIANCNVGATSGGSSICCFKNTLLRSCGTPFIVSGTWSNCSNNATDSSSFGGTYTQQGSDRVSQTFTFVNEVGENYLLLSRDSGALGYGADLHADSSYAFATDIIGGARMAPWSIGASQPAAVVTTKALSAFLMAFFR